MYAKEDLFGWAGVSIMLDIYLGKTSVENFPLPGVLIAIRAEHRAFEAGRVYGRAQAEACLETQKKPGESLAWRECAARNHCFACRERS